MRTTLVLAVVSVVVGGAAPLAGHAQVADTCFGLPATIVAAPDADRVLGTDGDDVIVAATAVAQVSALGGADAICVSGPSYVDAGSGDDRVLSTAASGATTVVLGSGSDLFEGSSGDDEVWTERVEDGLPVPDEGFGTVDTVRTWGGADVVHTGVWVHPNRDEVDLGDGPDTVHFSGNSGPASLTGGTGRDRFETWFPAPWSPVTYDLEAGAATVRRWGQDETYATIEDFEDLSVTVSTPVAVRGTDGPNRIFVDGPVTVDAGAGDDELALRGDPDAVRGGPGRDRVTMRGSSDAAERRVVYDLGRGELTRAGRTVPFEAEVLRVQGREDRSREHVRVIGSAHRDDVVVAACGAAVRGGAGPDRLRADSRGCGSVRTTLRGGGGADLLLGGRGRDVLLGGSGDDRAVGRRGTDRCRAEDEQGCEGGRDWP